MPNIRDVIVLNRYEINHYYVVVDQLPQFVFERQGNHLVAEDDGFCACYGYGRDPYAKAFGGSKFDIPLKDGTVEHASGQWWWCAPLGSQNPGPIISVGIATLAELDRCYVFSSCNIAKQKLDAWLAENEPSTDYEKYSKRKAMA